MGPRCKLPPAHRGLNAPAETQVTGTPQEITSKEKVGSGQAPGEHLYECIVCPFIFLETFVPNLSLKNNDPSLQNCFQTHAQEAVSYHCNTDKTRHFSYSNHIENCRTSCSILIWNKIFKLKIAVKNQR